MRQIMISIALITLGCGTAPTSTPGNGGYGGQGGSMVASTASSSSVGGMGGTGGEAGQGPCTDIECVSCDDGKLNGGETDVDCGGPNCPPCGLMLGCYNHADCDAGFCNIPSPGQTGTCGSTPECGTCKFAALHGPQWDEACEDRDALKWTALYQCACEYDTKVWHTSCLDNFCGLLPMSADCYKGLQDPQYYCDAVLTACMQ